MKALPLGLPAKVAYPIKDYSKVNVFAGIRRDGRDGGA